ncbi:hypothetical protein OF83DRAFT_1176833 [Amylostereum chailletii]|nr:hypothetical protein OF83DRAFT_1176833 [Amylostereum chailletii]
MPCKSRFSSLSYTPYPYRFSNIPFHELPASAQRYLFSINSGPLVPLHALLPTLHAHLVHDLARALQDSDTALVYLRREASLATLPDRRKDAERLAKVVHVLLPARKRVLENFITRFDTLVWLECEVLRPLGTPATRDGQRRFRDRVLLPLLQLTTRVLVALDEIAAQSDADVEVCARRLTDGWIMEVERKESEGKNVACVVFDMDDADLGM